MTPERRGQALRAVKATGIAGFSGMHPTLLRLLADGMGDEELAFGCQEAVTRGKGFAWAMQALWNRRQDALAPQAQAAPSKPAWKLAEEARAREWMGPFAPPAV